jgi:hypothetical protein
LFMTLLKRPDYLALFNNNGTWLKISHVRAPFEFCGTTESAVKPVC